MGPQPSGGFETPTQRAKREWRERARAQKTAADVEKDLLGLVTMSLVGIGKLVKGQPTADECEAVNRAASKVVAKHAANLKWADEILLLATAAMVVMGMAGRDNQEVPPPGPDSTVVEGRIID